MMWNPDASGGLRTILVLAVASLVAGAALPANAHHHEHGPEPYEVMNQWDGFIECAVGTMVASAALCSTLATPNDEFMLETQVDAGIETVVIAMAWDPQGGISGDELELIIDDGFTQFARVSGPPPLELRLDGLPENGTELRFRVFPSTDTLGVVYQQSFTVYHDHFYHAPAPADYSALPNPHGHSSDETGQTTA